MSPPVIGLSLMYPFCPEDQAAREKQLAHFSCGNCGAKGVDWQQESAQFLGSIVYQTLFRSCVCGFENKIFVVLNDLLGADCGQTAALALSSAREAGLLPDFRTHEGLYFLQLAVYRNEKLKALAIAQELTEAQPRDAMAWYNLGWVYANLDLTLDSLIAYGRALYCDGGFVEARENMEGLRIALGLEEKWMKDLDVEVRSPFEKEIIWEVVDQREGYFGQISVKEWGKGRFIWIDERVQGGAYFEPNASSCKAYLALEGRACEWDKQPGPIPFFPYQLAWAMVPQGFRGERGLMLGLGSGMGAVFLLLLFPDLSLDVVEIDLVMIEMARQYFPLLCAFEAAGRLRLIHADANPFVAQNLSYDFLLVDLFNQNIEFPEQLLHVSFFQNLAKSASRIFFNLIGQEDSSWILAICALFERLGRPIRAMTGSIPPGTWTQRDQNWMLGTELPKHHDLLERFQECCAKLDVALYVQARLLKAWSDSWVELPQN